jgi:hypothetical protein
VTPWARACRAPSRPRARPGGLDEIIPAIVVSAVGTLAFLLVVWLLIRARAWLRSYLARGTERRIELGAQEFAGCCAALVPWASSRCC